MGKQFRFLMDRKDEKRFLNYVLEKGKIYYDDIRDTDGRICEVNDNLINKDWFKVFFSTEDEVNVKYTKLPGGLKYIGGSDEPVIEYCRTGVNEPDKSVMRGRLWVEMKYYDKGELLTKGNALDELYRDLCKWIRKNLKKVTVEDTGRMRKEYSSESLIRFIEEGYSLLG